MNIFRCVLVFIVFLSFHHLFAEEGKSKGDRFRLIAGMNLAIPEKYLATDYDAAIGGGIFGGFHSGHFDFLAEYSFSSTWFGYEKEYTTVYGPVTTETSLSRVDLLGIVRYFPSNDGFYHDLAIPYLGFLGGYSSFTLEKNSHYIGSSPDRNTRSGGDLPCVGLSGGVLLFSTFVELFVEGRVVCYPLHLENAGYKSDGIFGLVPGDEKQYPHYVSLLFGISARLF